MTDQVEILSSDGLKVLLGRPGNILEVTVTAASSEKAVEGARKITDDELIAGTVWTSASVTDAKSSMLEIEGHKAGQVVVVLIRGGVSAGFAGSGAYTAAKILSRLFEFGEYDTILGKLTRPSRSLADPSRWFLHP